MKAKHKFAAMPTLAHIALSLMAVTAILMFNATSKADVINPSDADYASLQRTMIVADIAQPSK